MAEILITGATGMIGANLAHKLVSDGHRVHLMLRTGSNQVRLQPIIHDVVPHVAEITDSASVAKVMNASRPDVVFHLASTPFNPPIASPLDHFRVNAIGMLALLEQIKELPNVRLVFTGSGAVYEDGPHSSEDAPLKPATLLGASKAAATILLQTYVRLYRVNACELRLFTPYGPWDHPRRLIPRAILCALGNQNMPMTQGYQRRDFIYIDDVVDALLLAAKTDIPPGTVLNVGSGTGVPIRDLVESVFAMIDTSARPLFGALPTRADEIMEMSANSSQIQAVLNWRPRVSLRDGLEKTIAWVAAHQGDLLQLCAPGERLAA